MNIMICGASGMVGQALVTKLQDASGASYDLTLVGRSTAKLKRVFPGNFTYCSWSEVAPQLLEQQDFVVNLTGENIGAARWSKAQKDIIIGSRVEATSKLAAICVELGDKAPVLINASAIGIYGVDNPNICDESSTAPVGENSFLEYVTKSWEKALEPAINAGVKVVKLRFAVILAARGGALKKLLPSYKFGGGAVLGDGKQNFSWVDLDDVIAAIEFFIQHPEHAGIYNVVADEVVVQRQFATCLASVLQKPCFMHLPRFVVELIFGEMGSELLLTNSRISNAKLKSLGFKFKYPTLRSSLEHQLQSGKDNA
jgi:uncharacterized protein (TIGR01777 family)